MHRGGSSEELCSLSPRSRTKQQRARTPTANISTTVLVRSLIGMVNRLAVYTEPVSYTHLTLPTILLV